MCGIIGISSNKPVSANIINSLKKLEYRGYDSAGIATLSDGEINEVKSEGRVDNLENNFDLKNLRGNIGIGHVRWATHGVPNSLNAHPHSSHNVSVVHNGIIENSTILKKHLINKGHKFKSQTDTEVIVYLITENLKTSELEEAITKTLKQLHGSFALGIVFKDMPDLIVGARRGSPLAVGYGPNENYLGSDTYALKSMTNKITYIDDGEVCVVKKDQGMLSYMDMFLCPAGTIVSSGPSCSEQGSGRWLPKPSDTLNKFVLLLKPSVGFKNIPLIWYEMMDVSKIVGFILPDWIADIIPGKYPVHSEDGSVKPNLKSKVLKIVTGEVKLVKIPRPCLLDTS